MNPPFDENPNPLGLKPPRAKRKNPNEGQELVEENIAIRVANLSLTGMSYLQISAELKSAIPTITWRQVKRLLNSEECQLYVKELNDEMQRTSLAMARIEGPKLMRKALAVLNHHLDNNNIHAAALTFKITKVADEQAEKIVDSNITIVLPGVEQPKTIEADYVETDSK